MELHWQISALCFFNVSNRATFSKIFGRDFGAPKAQTSLAQERVVDMVLRYVVRPAELPNSLRGSTTNAGPVLTGRLRLAIRTN